MGRKVRLGKNKKGWASQPSKCPQCQATIRRSDSALKNHFLLTHQRNPSAGELRQFLAFKNSRPIYESGDFVKPKFEVSGGGFSPK